MYTPKKVCYFNKCFSFFFELTKRYIRKQKIKTWEDKVALGLRLKGEAQLQQSSKDLVQRPCPFLHCLEVSKAQLIFGLL